MADFAVTKTLGCETGGGIHLHLELSLPTSSSSPASAESRGGVEESALATEIPPVYLLSATVRLRSGLVRTTQLPVDVSDQAPGSPPEAAHSRGGDPGRFRLLPEFALNLLKRLEDEYVVTRTEAFEVLPDMVVPFPHERAPVTLAPSSPEAAPIAVAFTSPSSLTVRFGRWVSMPFPSCGCEACGETFEHEAERLEFLTGAVVAGQFHEAISFSPFGSGRITWSFGDVRSHPYRETGGGNELLRARPYRVLAHGSEAVHWRAWPRRDSGAG